MYPGEGLASAAGAPVVADRQLRLLGLALLASSLLHGLLLVLLPVLREAQPSKFLPPPLTARLAKPKPPELPKLEPALPPRAPQPHAAARPPRAAPARAVPQAPILAAEPAKREVEVAAIVPAAPPMAAPAPAARLEPAPAAAAGPDPASVARFRLALMDLARRYKRYPRIAQENNWEGRVELRLTYAESGVLTSMTVKRSAGRAVLDDEAQAMIRSAQAQATVPPALRGSAFTLEIPVEFSLKD